MTATTDPDDEENDTPANEGESSAVTRFREWVLASDHRLLLVLAGGLYLFFTVLAYLGGFQDAGSIISRLQTVTFLAVLYAMLALALNLQWGYAGLLNLGIAGFMAVGVYTMALLSMPVDATHPGLGLPLWIGIPGGVLAATALGALVALPAIRLRADYLAIVTLAFGEIIRLTIRSREAAEFTIAGRRLGTGGTDSIGLPPNPIEWLLYENPSDPSFIARESPTAIGSVLFDAGDTLGVSASVVESIVYTVFLIGILILFYWLLNRIGNSPFGRVLKAIRDDELVASSLGKDTSQFKIKTFALGCGLMGLVGILWFLERGSAAPTAFEPELTFFVFVALILGGSGSNTGSIVGGFIFAGVLFEGPNFIQRIVEAQFDRPSQPDTIFDAFTGFDPFIGYFFSDFSISALRFIVLGVVLIYLMQRRPDGLLGSRREIASSVELSRRGEEP